MAAKVQIGFVGAGFMGQLAHIRSYALLHEECVLVALAEPRRRRATGSRASRAKAAASTCSATSAALIRQPSKRSGRSTPGRRAARWAASGIYASATWTATGRGT